VELSDAQFEQLLALRTGLRRFLRWSEGQARSAGLTPAQHQLLLAVRGHRDGTGPTIGELADYLALRHHSASELVDRAVAAGLVSRQADADNATIVRVTATPLGLQKLNALTAAHLEELARLGPTMRTLWREIGKSERARDANATTPV
jgi:DNA-binding MarR family transcriptional regulator